MLLSPLGVTMSFRRNGHRNFFSILTEAREVGVARDERSVRTFNLLLATCERLPRLRIDRVNRSEEVERMFDAVESNDVLDLARGLVLFRHETSVSEFERNVLLHVSGVFLMTMYSRGR